MKEFWYFLTACWAIFRADKAWLDGFIQYSMMAEEDWEADGIENVEVNIVVCMKEGWASTITKEWSIED